MQNALRAGLLLFAVFLSAPAWAAAAPRTSKLLVVALADRNSPHFEAAVAENVTAPLANLDRVQVLPNSALVAALKQHAARLRVRTAVPEAIELGRFADATHVLVLVMDKNAVRLSLIELPEGNTILSRRYPGRKLSGSSASNIVQAVKGAFASAAVSTRGGSAADADADAEKVPTETEAPAPTPEVEAQAEVPASAHPPGWRPAVRFGIGFMLMQRQANLTSPGLSLPCYCASGNNSNPFFAAGHAYAELYPGSFAGDGTHWWEGAGLFAEFGGTRVASFGIDGKLTSNTVIDVRGGLVYRYVLWDSALAPDISGVVGYGTFSFPLQRSLFPSLAYTAPFIGVNGSVPLGIEDLALVAGAAYIPLLGHGAGTALGQQDSGGGVQLKGGLRIRLDMFEISAMYRYALYSATYKNAPVVLNDLSTRSANVKLTDALGELTLSGGLVF